MTTDSQAVHCPHCGKAASGKFCSHCGASLAAGSSPGPWNRQILLPWIAISLATVSLVLSLVTWFDRGGEAVPPTAVRFSQPAAPAAGMPGQPPDLSSMSPREAADRLFNRVMIASEQGQAEAVRQFAPMALQAYERANATDNDARYHVALIHLATGNTQGARTQIDKLRIAAPNHLMATMLEQQIAERRGDQAGIARANKAFLAAYDSEMAMARVEYQEHRSGIERFREAAKTVKR